MTATNYVGGEAYQTLEKLRRGTGHVPMLDWFLMLLGRKDPKKFGTSKEEIEKLKQKTYVMAARWALSDFRQEEFWKRDHTREENVKRINMYLAKANVSRRKIGTSKKELRKGEFD